jgi:hypothetical protein
MRTEIKWALVATAGIWASVGLIAAFAPDLINIADDEHVPLTQLLAAIGGAVATGYVWHSLVWRTRRAGHEAAAWAAPVTAAVTAALWATIAGISISAPLVLTGTDATRFPLAAFLSVIFGTVVTCIATRLVPRMARQTRQK